MMIPSSIPNAALDLVLLLVRFRTIPNQGDNGFGCIASSEVFSCFSEFQT